MRNVERIKPFLEKLQIIWEQDFPDWRFGQLMENFLMWIHSEKKRDPFYVEEKQMLAYLEEFSMVYRG